MHTDLHTRPTWSRRFVLLLGAGLTVAVGGCRPKPVPAEELYNTRTLGLGYLYRNEFAEADSQFRKLIALAPDDPAGYANLGLTYLQAGRYGDAEPQLERAIALDPTNVSTGILRAKLFALTGRPAAARTTLEKLRATAPRNVNVLYGLAELEAVQTDSATTRRYAERLRAVLAVAPANLAVRVKLLAALAKVGDADSVVRQLEEVRRIPPEPPREARVYLDSTIALLRTGTRAAEHAQLTLDRFVHLMESTTPFQAALEEVRTTDAPIPGRLLLNFAPRDFVSLHGARSAATIDSARFIDATEDAGLASREGAGPPAALSNAPSITSAIATGDIDGTRIGALFLSRWSPEAGRSVAQLFRVQGGSVRDVTPRSGIVLPQGAAFAIFADYDNDGWLDLFVIGGEGRGHLFRNNGDGTFVETTSKAGVGDVHGARKAIFADLDHDGDLDLLLVGSSQRTLYRNNLDGTFSDATATFGLASNADARDVVFGDFDGDGRTDLFVANARGGDALLRNGGAQHFSDVTTAAGLSTTGGSGAVTVGDYNNDGFLDLFVAGANGGAPVLWLNTGSGSFAPDRRSNSALQALGTSTGVVATFVDYDNDGWLDLVVGTAAATSSVASNAASPARGAATPALFLFRNDGTGRFVDRSAVLPAAVRARGASAIAVLDVDDDGDEDLVLTDAAGAARVLRNERGNSNLGVNVELKGLRTGSGKNNSMGIGARLELRAGTLYQTRVVAAARTHFGLGPHLKADVLRVEWTNGVPQTIYFPGSDQDVVEQEILKGSCAFAYTWDGKQFRFVTDAMWRSALGMPLGLMGSSSAFAPAGASQEYLRISGDALKPRDGRYVLQFTEELWETAYADEVKLLTVDHPDSIDVFVDERFVPPGPVTLKLYQVGHRELPRSAIDEQGHDLLPALRASDDVYVSNLVPTQYQGVVEPHDLILDLPELAGAPNTALYLRGWIYPTDASINVALGQQSSLTVSAPSLEVRDARGQWQVAIANLGFPSGKDKTMVIELAGKFLTADHHVRIRTNMQIYWDQAFVARDLAGTLVKVETLAPVAANLHSRGFSRTYRKGGRYGPWWFDYGSVERASPWRPITGAFTRFGDVLPLLTKADDAYIIMAPGDETTIEFDARSAASLAPGWRRDFLLYTDGWIKDSDLNTAFGTTVDPLPFHGIRSYPYSPSDSYPRDSLRTRYLKQYNTRVIGRAAAPQ